LFTVENCAVYTTYTEIVCGPQRQVIRGVFHTVPYGTLGSFLCIFKMELYVLARILSEQEFSALITLCTFAFDPDLEHKK
jgi:hypothetical protein